MLLTKFLKLFEKLENQLLFILVLGMLGFSLLQIFLRNFFESGLTWSEALIRLMVLWAAMIGSMVAARSAQHIRIDLLERYASKRFHSIIIGCIHVLTALVCFALVYFSFNFLLLEYEDSTEAFAGLSNWIFITIIPVSFLIMGLRYLLISLTYLIEQRR